MEAIKLSILRVKELIVKGNKAKPRILIEEDIWVDFIAKQVV